MAVKILDKKDLKILEILKENARASSQEIAKKTLIPITTVHNRIKKLEKQGIIKGYTVLLDNKKLGRIITAYILITMDYRFMKQAGLTQADIAKKIKAYDFVEEVNMVTGTKDIIAKVRVESIEQLDEFLVKYLRNIDGIASTETMVVLSEI